MNRSGAVVRQTGVSVAERIAHAPQVLRFPRPAVPDGMSVRAAHADDLPAIRELVAGERHLSRQGLDVADRFVVVTDRHDRVVGAAQAKPAGRDGIELASLVVAPRSRGARLGQLLLWELLHRRAPAGSVDAREGGVFVRVRPSDTRFHEPLGFETVDALGAPRTFVMKATAVAGHLGLPARVMQLAPRVRVDLAVADAREGRHALRAA